MTTMAKTVITTDDLDGSSNAQEVTFSYQGRSYSIDPGRKNQAAFDKALKPYVDAAQRDVRTIGVVAPEGRAPEGDGRVEAWSRGHPGVGERERPRGVHPRPCFQRSH